MQSTVKRTLAWAALGALVIAVSVALTSLWIPRILGVEKSWDLRTGTVEYRQYICGFLMDKKVELTGLEGVLDSVTNRILSESNVLLFERSILQPGREGRWGKVLHYSLRIRELAPAQNSQQAHKLVKLIDTCDIAGLKEWDQADRKNK